MSALALHDDCHQTVLAEKACLSRVVTPVCRARPLTPLDTFSYRGLFLRALREEGCAFGPLYEVERETPLDIWRHRCTPTDNSCYFGLFVNGVLAGSMFAKPMDKDSTGQAALWGGAYMAPDYRGYDLGAALYKCREEWTRKHPTYKYAMFYILNDNERSAEIHRKQGADYAYSQLFCWPGRPPALWNWYKKQLKV